MDYLFLLYIYHLQTLSLSLISSPLHCGQQQPEGPFHFSSFKIKRPFNGPTPERFFPFQKSKDLLKVQCLNVSLLSKIRGR